MTSSLEGYSFQMTHLVVSHSLELGDDTWVLLSNFSMRVIILANNHHPVHQCPYSNQNYWAQQITLMWNIIYSRFFWMRKMTLKSEDLIKSLCSCYSVRTVRNLAVLLSITGYNGVSIIPVREVAPVVLNPTLTLMQFFSSLRSPVRHIHGNQTRYRTCMVLGRDCNNWRLK